MMPSCSKGGRSRKREYNSEEENIGCLGRHSSSALDDDPENNPENEASEQEQLEKLLLAKYNAIVQGQGTGNLPDSIWDEWLWHSDPLQECHMDLMMNRMHLLGLLIARYRASRLVHVIPASLLSTSLVNLSLADAGERAGSTSSEAAAPPCLRFCSRTAGAGSTYSTAR